MNLSLLIPTLIVVRVLMVWVYNLTLTVRTSSKEECLGKWRWSTTILMRIKTRRSQRLRSTRRKTSVMTRTDADAEGTRKDNNLTNQGSLTTHGCHRVPRSWEHASTANWYSTKKSGTSSKCAPIALRVLEELMRPLIVSRASYPWFCQWRVGLLNGSRWSTWSLESTPWLSSNQNDWRLFLQALFIIKFNFFNHNWSIKPDALIHPL